MEAYMFPFIYHTRPRADAKEVLRRLRQLGLKVAIVSNVLSGRHITDALEKWGLIEYFDVTIYSDEIGFRKPRSEIFNYALLMLGVSAGEAVMVGDDFESDVKGALNIGMKAIYLSDSEEVNYKFTVRSLMDAFKIIGEWI